jgi:HK97 family phage portal protein
VGMLSTFRARAALALANFAEKIAAPGILKRAPRTLSGVDDSRGWFSLLARHVGFQTNTVETRDSVHSQSTVFSSMTQIASDIGKMRARLMELADGIWTEITSAAFSPVLRKPNHFQTWQRFIEQWVLSLLSNGNAYILKVRDNRSVVVALYVLDPTRCRPLVATSGDVFYALGEDDLSRVHTSYEGENALPASEIIHDRINCLFHPLVGISPLFACSLAATKALKADQNASRFFANQSQPGGVLTAPGEISDPNAARLKEYFETRFTGENAGKVAVLGDGLQYTPMTTNAVDAQLVEQLKLSAEQIAAVFKIPGYLVGAAPVPPNNNIEALRLDYYQRCLQSIIEGIENSLDDGLALGKMADGRTLGIELDLDALLRMDSATRVEMLTKASGGAYMKPNEARKRDNLPPAAGGDALYKQQQDYSLAALAERDANKPFAKPAPAPAAAPAAPAAPAADDEARAEAAAAKAAADEAHRAVQALTERLTSADARVADAERARAEAERRATDAEAQRAEATADQLRTALEALPERVSSAVAKAMPEAQQVEPGELAASVKGAVEQVRSEAEEAAAESLAAALITRLAALEFADA